MSKPDKSAVRDTDVVILSQILRDQRHHVESLWLRQVWNSPDKCDSPGARAALKRAADLAQEAGFPAIAAWLIECLDPADG